MPHAYLVTGTDTGIGKTTVACGIAAALRRRGLDVGVLKPVETGCSRTADGTLLAADATQLGYFAGLALPLDRLCPYRFSDPLAPSVAAQRAGRPIELAALIGLVDRFTPTAAVTLVEGAGGLLVPLCGSSTFADLALACRLELLVVVGNRLGAVNHALLTVRWAQRCGLTVAGYVINTLHPEPDLAMQTNTALLAELLGPALGTFPWVGAIACTPADRERLADAAERTLTLDRLLPG
ncbi:MAG: dethiobiotin synthase [Candidatus Binatia bacterium]